jgi:hypothetical protein
MPERDPRSTYDSTVSESTGKKITTEMEEAHQAALKTEVKVAALVAALKSIAPNKADSLDAKLAKCQAGALPAAAMHTLLKLEVGMPAMLQAYSDLVPGFDKDFVWPAGYQHPITV